MEWERDEPQEGKGYVHIREIVSRTGERIWRREGDIKGGRE
jgi:hypothetical protein